MMGDIQGTARQLTQVGVNVRSHSRGYWTVLDILNLFVIKPKNDHGKKNLFVIKVGKDHEKQQQKFPKWAMW